MIEPSNKSMLTSALQQYISINCLSNPNMYVQVQDLLYLQEAIYSGYAIIMENQIRFRFLAEVRTDFHGSRQVDVKGVYFDASFLIGYLQDQFKPSLDSALLEELVRREVKNIMKRILGAS